jgi:hypothetical protein
MRRGLSLPPAKAAARGHESMAPALPCRCKLTPPEVAQRFGIDPAKVLAWIRSGELRAMNAATTRSGRPRYLIDEADLAAFEMARSTTPAPKVQRKRRQPRGDVIEFF